MSFLTTVKLFSFLVTYEFWSRIGFFLGYVCAFLLVLEVVRLASSDANRKEMEKMLDSYAASRSMEDTRRASRADSGLKVSIEELVRQPQPQSELKTVSLDELEDMKRKSVLPETISDSGSKKFSLEELEHMQRRARTPSPAATRTLEPAQHTPTNEEKRRRRATFTSISPKAAKSASRSASLSRAQAQTSSSSSPSSQRLRKRSDTLTSSTSTESKDNVRRKRREASPAESKTSSRHASPTPKSKSKEARTLGGSLGKMLRSRG